MLCIMQDFFVYCLLDTSAVIKLALNRGAMQEATPTHRVHGCGRGWLIIIMLCACATLTSIIPSVSAHVSNIELKHKTTDGR